MDRLQWKWRGEIWATCAFWAWMCSSRNTGVSGSVRPAVRSPVFTGNSHPIVSTGVISLVQMGARNAGTQPIAISTRPQGISTQNRQPRTGSSTYVTLPTVDELFSVERQERQGWGRAHAQNYHTQVARRPENRAGPGTQNGWPTPTARDEGTPPVNLDRRWLPCATV